MLRAYSLFDIVDGSKPYPAKFMRGDDGHLLTTVNPAYDQWIVVINQLVSFSLIVYKYYVCIIFRKYKEKLYSQNSEFVQYM